MGAGGADPCFIGATAIAQFNANGGGVCMGTPVPVENLGVPVWTIKAVDASGRITRLR